MDLRHLISLLLIGIVLVSGCIGESKVVCNKPYIRVGTTCCLDRDDNKICDIDDIITTTNATTTTTSTLITTNTAANILPKPAINKSIPTTRDRHSAVVSTVIDGDTIKLQTGEVVRLLGINADERGQDCYMVATERLEGLILGKKITLERDVDDKDQYGRLLRFVFVNETNINQILVREGLATTYFVGENTKYKTELKAAEKLAKDMENLGCMWLSPLGNPCSDCIDISYFHWNAKGNDCDNLNDEYVTFKNSCIISCDLTNWTVRDESSRDAFVFPDFTFESGATVTLYTGCGTNTKTKSYWCSSGRECDAIWNNNGDTLYLRDSNGNLCQDYTYEGQI